MTTKKLSNVEIKTRIRQILLLIVVILIGVIISVSAEAQSFHKANRQHFKEKYKAQISVGNKACDILNKKRTARPRTPLFASLLRRKPKYKPQAEVDTPVVQTQSRTPKFRRADPLFAGN